MMPPGRRASHSVVKMDPQERDVEACLIPIVTPLLVSENSIGFTVFVPLNSVQSGTLVHA